MNLSMAAAYLRHMLSARNAHALHSPFLFELYNRVIRNQKTSEVDSILRLRRDVKQDHRIISSPEFGAGSRSGMGADRMVREIVRKSAVPHKYGALLYRLVRHLRADHILELGTSVGFGTCYLAKGLSDANSMELSQKVFTIDVNEGAQDVAKEHISRLQLDERVEFLHGLFDDALVEYRAVGPQKIDLLYMDGDHRYESTLRYFDLLKDRLHENSVVVLDDIYWSADMTRAWNALRNAPEVCQSIDLCRFGLLFFRSRQLNEHFRLRL